MPIPWERAASLTASICAAVISAPPELEADVTCAAMAQLQCLLGNRLFDVSDKTARAWKSRVEAAYDPIREVDRLTELFRRLCAQGYARV